MDAYEPHKSSRYMEHRVSTLEVKVETLMDRANDLEARLRGIEKSVWKSTGVLAFLQVVLTIVVIAVKILK